MARRIAAQPDSTPWRTINQAATYYAVDRRTIYRWIAEGRLKAYRLGGQQIRIRQEDLDSVLTEVSA